MQTLWKVLLIDDPLGARPYAQGLQAFNKHSLNVYYMPGTALSFGQAKTRVK